MIANELTIFAWLMVAAALVGTVFNIRQDRRGFYIWSVTNAGLAGVNVITGQWAQALLFGVYFVLALVGVHQWQKQEKRVKVTIRQKPSASELLSPRRVTVVLGQEVCSFSSFENWCDTAQQKWKMHGLTHNDTLCLDAKNRICTKGKEFMRARDEGAFPVRVFAQLCD
jgi:uncharacterized membrane protein YidH (DUF202 family)